MDLESSTEEAVGDLDGFSYCITALLDLKITTLSSVNIPAAR